MTDPAWLTNLEATARENLFMKVSRMRLRCTHVLALCKLVRELGEALALNLEDFEGEIAANENQPSLYNEVATAILGRLAKDNKEVLEAYQLGPVTGEET